MEQLCVRTLLENSLKIAASGSQCDQPTYIQV